MRVLQSVFLQYGLPRAIRSDNGAPFASRAIAGLSRLSVVASHRGGAHFFRRRPSERSGTARLSANKIPKLGGLVSKCAARWAVYWPARDLRQ